MKKSLALARVAAAVAVAAGLISEAAAHHGWADFDRGRTVEVSGVVTESRYANPHCEVRLQTEEGEWFVELSAVPRMRRRGLTAEMIKPGTRLTLVGHPHKKKEREMKAIRMVREGREYDLNL
jgi:hypothetical protein